MTETPSPTSNHLERGVTGRNKIGKRVRKGKRRRRSRSELRSAWEDGQACRRRARRRGGRAAQAHTHTGWEWHQTATEGWVLRSHSPCDTEGRGQPPAAHGTRGIHLRDSSTWLRGPPSRELGFHVHSTCPSGEPESESAQSGAQGSAPKHLEKQTQILLGNTGSGVSPRPQ